MAINPDRIKITDNPDRRPMHDLFDKDFEGPVINLGVNLDRFFGDIFIKVEHFKWIASDYLGMVNEEEHRAVMAQTAEVREELLEVYAELESLKAERQETFNAKLTEFLANYSDKPADAIDPVPPVAANEPKGGTGTKAKDSKGKTQDLSLDGL